MKHARIARAIAIALALAVAGTALTAPHATAAPKAAKSSGRAAGKTAATHQFTGVVTAMDPSSLTVEKGGKNPKRMTFERRPDMSIQGTVERDARVTVYYRDQDGRTVAHRVVAKDATAPSAK